MTCASALAWLLLFLAGVAFGAGGIYIFFRVSYPEQCSEAAVVGGARSVPASAEGAEIAAEHRSASELITDAEIAEFLTPHVPQPRPYDWSDGGGL